jgi:SAM-dependent methyltransferase
MEQKKSKEWLEQWKMFHDDERFLFEEWIHPVTLQDFTGKTVLECGCGGGQHTAFMLPYAKKIVATDLNTVELAREKNKGHEKVVFREYDIATMDIGEQFDIVICIGVIHHTDDPDRTFHNIYRHCKPGGMVIIWTYSAEGNELVRFLVEPARRVLLSKMPGKLLHFISSVLTVSLYPFVYSLYRIPFLRFLPYYDYFGNFRKMHYKRNLLNVFDKLNAPQTRFTTLLKCNEWFNASLFAPESITIKKYKNTSYTLVGRKRLNPDV